MGPLEHQLEISAKMALEQKLQNKKNAILASAKGSAHASFTVLTANVLGGFFDLEMHSLMCLNTSSTLSQTSTFLTHLTEQNIFWKLIASCKIDVISPPCRAILKSLKNDFT